MRGSTKALSSHGAGVLIVKNQHVLLVQMNYSRYKGQWILPGGMLQEEEHPHFAAKREFFEETGHEVNICGLHCVRYRKTGTKPDNAYWVFTGELSEKLDKIEDYQFKWDTNELVEVKFWKVQDLMNSPEVRPQTKMYIKLFFHPESIPSPLKLEGEHQDYLYF